MPGVSTCGAVVVFLFDFIAGFDYFDYVVYVLIGFLLKHIIFQ